MIIGFAGSHGTGKTTTLDALDDIMDFRQLSSTSRDVGEAGYPLNQEATPLSQLLITVTRANQGYQFGRDMKIAIADRTPLDSLAYTSYQMDRVWEGPETPEYQYYMKASEDLVHNSMYMYSQIFYFPIYWPPADDGVRKTDEIYQAVIDERINTYLKKWNILAFTVPNASPLERAHFIKQAIAGGFNMITTMV